MKILIGTTNPSKVKRFSELLSETEAEFITLSDLGIISEPDETGSTPEDNAAIKAIFYGRYFDKVICNDSGLYFDNIPLDDPRQPGLNVRSPKGKRLSDDEMIEYYSGLIKSFGGRVLAVYLDGVAVYNNGKVTSFMENGEATRESAFYMVDAPSPKRHPGWPLDSISVNRNTGVYFVDKTSSSDEKSDENIMLGEYRKRLKNFLLESLELNK